MQRYFKYEELGHGSMGVVYRASDRLEHGRWVALKQLYTDGGRMDIDTTQIDNRRLVMSQEFRILASLRHPHIISVLDYGFSGENGEPYFTMDLLENPENIVQATEDSTFEEKIHYFVQCLEGLAYLHKHRVVHRDLKPDNILLQDGKVKILDFGLAYGDLFKSQAGIDKDYIAGTMAYIAPEILQEQSPDHLSDLYALGMIMAEVFLRRYPYLHGNNMVTLITSIINKYPNLEEIDINLQPILIRMLDKDPQNRYQSAQNIIIALSERFDFVDASESVQVRENVLRSAPFVGRESEFKALRRSLLSLINIREAIGSSWLIGGESGVGKSRLLNEIRVQGMIRGILVLNGQSTYEGGAVFEVWRQPLRHLCLEVEPTNDEASILKSIIPDLESLLGRTINDAPPALNPKIALERLLTAIEAWFKRCKVPILLILEDIHWAVENLLILKRLLPLVNEMPLMIICSYRNEEAPEIPQELPNMQLMELEPLSRQAIIDLSTSLMDTSQEQTKTLVDLMERETKGNALFIIEILRALADTAGRIDLVGKQALPESIVQGGLKQIIQQRLSAINGELRAFLRVATLVGRQLDIQLMIQMLPDYDVEQMLQEATATLIIEVSENRYRFVHDKFREILDSEIENRADWHRRIAEGIEALYQQDRTRAPILLYHWKLANNEEKIVYYAELAGDQSMENGANLQAKNYYYEAYNLCSQLDDTLENKRRQVYLAVKLSKVAAYHPEESLTRIMHHAVEIAESLDDEELLARALGSTGAYYFMLGQTGASMDYFKRSMVIAENLNLEELLLLPYNIIGRSVALVGDFATSRNYLRDGIRIAEKFKDLELLSGSLAFYALSLMLQGAYSESVAIIDRSIKVAQQVGQSRMTGTLVINGCGYMWTGRWDDALKFFNEAEELAEKINDFLPLYWSRGFLGYIHLQLGNYEQAEHYLDLAISMIQDGKTVFHLPLFKAYRAELTLYQDQPNNAITQAEEALQFGRDTQQGLAIGEALCTLGKIYSHQNQLDEAKSYYQQSRDNHIEGGRLVQEAVTLYHLARHHTYHGETKNARVIVDEAIEKFTQYQMHWYLGQARKLRASLD